MPGELRFRSKTKRRIAAAMRLVTSNARRRTTQMFYQPHRTGSNAQSASRCSRGEVQATQASEVTKVAVPRDKRDLVINATLGDQGNCEASLHAMRKNSRPK